MKSSDVDQELFTESYCRVCSAQLISESQRVAHYEVGRARYRLPRSVTRARRGLGCCPPSRRRRPRGNSALKTPCAKDCLLVASYSVNGVAATSAAARLVFGSARVCKVRLRSGRDRELAFKGT